MTEKNKGFSLIPAAVGLLLSLGVMTAFSACGPKDDGAFMNCHNAQICAACLGMGMAVLFAVAAFVDSKTVVVVCNVITLLLSVITFLVPGSLMKLCLIHTMRCHSVFNPFVRIMSVITAIFALLGIFRKNMK